MISYTRHLISAIAVILLLSCSGILATETFDEILADIPNVVGPGNWGNDFWFTLPPNLEAAGAGPENTVHVFVTSFVQTKVTIEVEGKGFETSQYTNPNNTIEFKLNPIVAQPYLISGLDFPIAEDIYKSAAVHVYSEGPISVYVLSKFKQSGEGFLAIPSTALGKEYIISSYPDASLNYPLYNALPSLSAIVATEDNTTVEFTMGGNSQSRTAGDLFPGETAKRTLHQGDIWMFSSKPTLNNAMPDLSGSYVKSDKPIAVISGNQNTNIPTNNIDLNYLVEMEIPMYAWGNNYLVGKIKNRKYSSVVRVYAQSDNTKIFKNGSEIGTIATKGGVDGIGYLEIARSSNFAESFVVSGDKPIYVVQYNTGTAEDGYPEPIGDPFKVSLLAVEQFPNEIMFSTPGRLGTGYYKEHFVNLVFPVDELQRIPDDLEFSKIRFGKTNWQKINALYPSYDDIFPLEINGKYYALLTMQLESDGVYKFRSDKGIFAYLYGYSGDDAYSYPASLRLTDLQKQDTIAPVVDWILNCDGTVEGSVIDLPEEASKRSNLSAPIFLSDESFNYIDYQIVFDNERRKAEWHFRIADMSKDARFVIKFYDKNGNETVVYIEYTALKISIEPNIIDFGNMVKGSNDVKKFKIVNLSEDNDFTIENIGLKFADQGFEILDGALPITISAGSKSQDFEVRFSATENGNFLDSISVGDTCVTLFQAELRATVSAPIIVAEDVDFADQTISTSSTRYVNINNEGSYDLHLTDYSGPKLQEFKLINMPNLSPTEPLIIKKGKPYKLEIEFDPIIDGEYIDTIYFENNANDNIDPYVVISGTGIKPGLEAGAYNWGRKRIYRTEHPVDAYSSFNSAIELKNTGSNTVTVTGFGIDKDNFGNAFLFDPNEFNGLTIEPGGREVIETTFLPQNLGKHEIVINIQDNSQSNAKAILKGFGVVPKYTVSEPQFEITVVGKEESASRKFVRIRNLDTENWEYSDTLVIYDILKSSGVSGDWLQYGSSGFKLNLDVLSFPIKLAPGDELSIEIEFLAPSQGSFSELITLVSDAVEEIDINLTGIGNAVGFMAESINSSVCLGFADTMYTTLYNYGNIDLNISRVWFDPLVPSLNFLDTDLAMNGFVLKAKDSLEFGVIYQPTERAVSISSLVFDNQNGDNVIAEISATGFTLERNISISPVQQSIDIGKKVKLSVILDEGLDISDADLEDFDIIVYYDSSVLEIEENSLRKGDVLSQFDIVGIQNNDGIMQISIESITGTNLNKSGTLISFEIQTYLPKTDENSFSVDVALEPKYNECVKFTVSTGIISLQSCGGNLRRIVISDQPYALQSVLPNPVKKDFTLNYYTAFDEHLELQLYNVSGELIRTLYSGQQTAGEHTLNCSTDNISNGVYYCRMTSGAFTDAKMLIISK